MSAYVDMGGYNIKVLAPLELSDTDAARYEYERDLLLKKHEAQLVALQIVQFEELRELALMYKDYERSETYEKLIKNRKTINRM